MIFTWLLLWSGAALGAPSQVSRVALVQMDPDRGFGRKSLLFERARAWAERAVQAGASWILFPEGSSTGYATGEAVWCASGLSRCEGRRCAPIDSVAEGVPRGPTTQAWLKWARAKAAHVIFWIPEREGSKFYNTLVAVGPTGVLAKYRKRDLYRLDRCWANAGNSPAVISTSEGRWGMMTCLDVRDEGRVQFAEYKRLGVEGVLVSMNWDESPEGPAAAAKVLERRARLEALPLFVADSARWDGTGGYLPGGGARLRNGLPQRAAGREGMVILPMRRDPRECPKSGEPCGGS